MDEYAYTVESLRRQLSKALDRIDPHQQLYILTWLQERLSEGRRPEADNLHSALFLATTQGVKK